MTDWRLFFGGGVEGDIKVAAWLVNIGILLTVVRVEVFSVSPCHRIILAYLGWSHLKVSFEPLDHLQIVLISSLCQFVDVNLLAICNFFQSLLENLQIAHELILKLSLPVNFGHGDYMLIIGIYQLTVDRAWSQIFNINNIQVKGVVDPLQKLVFGDEISLIHYANNCLSWHLL